MNIDAEVLIKEAIEARKMAYTPYSHFKSRQSIVITEPILLPLKKVGSINSM